VNESANAQRDRRQQPVRAAPDDSSIARLRVPPQSLEAEQSILGGLLLDPSAFAKVSDILGSDDFYRPEHRTIFDAIAQIIAAARPLDVITLHEQLEGETIDYGGLPYLNALGQSVPSAANIRRYAEIVVERATLRRIIAQADEMATRAFRGDASVSLLDDAKVALGRLELDRQVQGRRVPLMTMDALRESAGEVRWLVKRMVPAESLGMLFGGSGTFKSFVALDAALHIAHGLPWLGRRTTQGPVLYIAAEGGAGLWARVQAWHQARRLSWQDVPFYAVPAAVDLTSDAWRVVDAAQGVGVRPLLVVVDTLSQTYSGEENSANEMAAYFRELGARFRQLWKCAVLLIHHSGHLATERPRGSSAIRANLDFMFGVFRDEKEMLATMACAKQKDGEAFDEVTFSLSSQTLGTDSDGDAVTSLVARHLSSAEEVQEAADIEVKAGRSNGNKLFLSLAQNGAKESDIRQAFYAESGLSETEARRQAYWRARKWAMTKGFVDIAQGVVMTLRRSN
jgi:hypothetical protein